MAQSVPPGDIATQPNSKVVFNAPYDDKHTYHIKVINSSARRIGWAFKTTNMKRLGVDPACGVLDPKEPVLVAVSCDAFAYGQEDTNNDRITIEWTNTPDGAAKQFRREWFQGDGRLNFKMLDETISNHLVDHTADQEDLIDAFSSFLTARAKLVELVDAKSQLNEALNSATRNASRYDSPSADIVKKFNHFETAKRELEDALETASAEVADL